MKMPIFWLLLQPVLAMVTNKMWHNTGALPVNKYLAKGRSEGLKDTVTVSGGPQIWAVYTPMEESLRDSLKEAGT